MRKGGKIITDKEITKEELEKINRYTQKEMTAEEIYVFSLILCDNEIDRQNEKFTVEALGRLAELFVGKTGIFDHDMSGKDQTARIFDAFVETDSSRKTADGEPYTFVKAKAYMVRNDKNKDLISEIEAGIKKETSVGCSVGAVRCSVCGEDVREADCGHEVGELYGDKLCCHLLCEPADAYEWSFVAVPAQKNAGVIKSFSNGEYSRWADEFRDELTKSIMVNASKILPTADRELMNAVCAGMDFRQLRRLRDAFLRQAEKNLPLVRQLKADETVTAEDNNDFMI